MSSSWLTLVGDSGGYAEGLGGGVVQDVVAGSALQGRVFYLRDGGK